MEMLVVILIISTLAGVLFLAFGGAAESAKSKKTRVRLEILSKACGQYRTYFREYPPVQPHRGSANLTYCLGRERTVKVQENPPLTKKIGPLVELTADWVLGGKPDSDPPPELIDGFETPLQYERPAPGRFTIRSAGPDQEMGTADDIVVTSPAGEGP